MIQIRLGLPVRTVLLAASGLFIWAGTASADIFDYTLSGSLGDTITFALPQMPTPLASCTFSVDCFSVFPVAVTINGTTIANATVSFYTPANDGGLTIMQGPLYTGGNALVNNNGPGKEQLFTGTLANPTLESFTNLQLLQTGAFGPKYDEAFLLNETTTPEPSLKVLLLLGLLTMVGVGRRLATRG